MSRKTRQRIQIGNDVTVTVLAVHSGACGWESKPHQIYAFTVKKLTGELRN